MCNFLLNAGAMVQGVLGRLTPEEMLEFQKFALSVGALVAGNIIDGGYESQHKVLVLICMP